MICDLAEFECTVFPSALVFNAIITNEFTFAVELMICKRASVCTAIREVQSTLSMIKTTLEITIVVDTLALF